MTDDAETRVVTKWRTYFLAAAAAVAFVSGVGSLGWKAFQIVATQDQAIRDVTDIKVRLVTLEVWQREQVDRAKFKREWDASHDRSKPADPEM